LNRRHVDDCINSDVRFVICTLLCLVWTSTLWVDIYQTEDSMTKTKTVVTTKDVEMVECSSCGQDIEKKEAHYFIIRNAKFKDELSSGQTEGWACEHCVDEPISFPVMYRTLGENTNFSDLALAIACLVFAVMFILKSIQMLLPVII